ncbi:MAG: TatD family hydrolase [Actinomycetota bacterium]
MSAEGPAPTGVDTHCHLFLLDDASAAVAAARAAGVDRLVCVGTDPGTSRSSVEYAESFAGVFATAGHHPNDASTFDDAAGRAIEELVADPRVVGVGECGLDFFRLGAPVEDQERVFRIQMGIARGADLPLVIHVRDAWTRMLRLLEEGRAERVVLHCFSGDAAIARECVERGYFLSFAGNVTYPSNGHLREAAAATPLDRLLTETDSPFLAPQGFRGRPNGPEHAATVAEALAAARGEDPAAVRAATAANALRAFPRLR